MTEEKESEFQKEIERIYLLSEKEKLRLDRMWRKAESVFMQNADRKYLIIANKLLDLMINFEEIQNIAQELLRKKNYELLKEVEEYKVSEMGV